MSGTDAPLALCAFISAVPAGPLVGDMGVASIVGAESTSRLSEVGVESDVDFSIPVDLLAGFVDLLGLFAMVDIVYGV